MFAKVVSVPTPTSWSQAYNAGKLFAVLSLTKQEPAEDLNQLPTLGKAILDTLEQEYFTIEDKNLANIKQAVTNACTKIPDDVSFSFVVGSIIQNALYVFIKGSGKVVLKRGEKIGTVLTSGEVSQNSEVLSASGLLENHDIIVFETEKFVNIVSPDTLSSYLNNHAPSEIAESLAPRVHGQEAGDACAIIVTYNKEEEEVENTERIIQGKVSFLDRFKNIPNVFALASKIFIFKRRFPSVSLDSSRTHSKKFFLTIAVVILIVLIVSVSFAIKKRGDEKSRVLFEKTYDAAKTKYEEGEGLLNLNKNLAREDLEEARKILVSNISQFKKGSSEQKQLADLLKKTEGKLEIASAVNMVEEKPVSEDNSPLLAYELKNIGKGVFSEDAANIYLATDKEIASFDKKSEKSKTLIKNDSDWKSAGAVATYLTNIYLLDKEDGVHKFVATGSGYTKTNYFAEGVSPDLANSSSMAIDTSVWILTNDGTILKFTRGKADSFTVTGLEDSLSNPLRIFTNTDTNNLYVLDKGNSRIVVFNKKGEYQAQYRANILKDAIDFDVREGDKKIFILAKDKVYEIGIK